MADNAVEVIEAKNEQLAESAWWHLRILGRPMTTMEMLQEMALTGLGPDAGSRVGKMKQLERALRSEAGQRRGVIGEQGTFPPSGGSGRPARVRWTTAELARAETRQLARVG